MSQDRTALAPQIVDEASEWFVAMREASATAEVRAAFTEWLRASPVHVRAYLEIAKLWGDAAHLGPQVAAVAATDEWSANVVPFGEAGAVSGNARTGVASKAFAGRRGFAVAASLLAACLLAGWYVTRPPIYAADVGEQRVIILDDGSTVKLNSRSRLAVRMNAARRDLELLEGQALFQVAQETARPFIVRSGGLTVQALGTQFDVNRKRAATVVTVVEGRVKVGTAAGAPPSAETAGTSPALGEKPATFIMSAGEQATLDARGTLERQPGANVAAATRWQQQELVFENESLGAVLEEFNRYSRKPIVLSDPSLADLRINAVFRTTAPDALLRFVTRFDGVEVERTEHEIRIRRKP